MQINVYPKESNQIPAYLIAFLIHSNQVGVGILGFQRVIAKEAGHDAWISVAIAGIAVHLVVWVIFMTLSRYPSADLYGINRDVFGKWLGNLINLLYMIYFTMAAIVVLRSYTEVVQAWMFPEVSTWSLSAVILGLTLYTILGGIRVITGYTFISLLVTFWLITDLYFPLEYARWSYLYPVLQAKMTEILHGSVSMSLTIIGFEVAYVLYPFLKEKQKAGVFAQMGVLYTNLSYLVLMIVSLTFFSKEQLMKTIWATLNLQQMVYVPFLERFEILLTPLWLLIILPNLMLYTWSVSRGLKRMFQWSQKRNIYLVMLVVLVVSPIFVRRSEINALDNLVARVGIYAAFVYPLFLFFMVEVKRIWRKRAMGGQSSEDKQA